MAGGRTQNLAPAEPTPAPGFRAPDPSGPSPSSDAPARIMGFAILGIPLYYIFVWRNLSGLSPTQRWVLTLGVLAALLLIYILWQRHTARVFEIAGNLLLVMMIIGGAAIISVYFAEEQRTTLFKLLTIAYFAFLPAWLYLQFLSTRGRTVWDEYVINLYRLRMDHDAHLPEPPRHSIYHTRWQTAYDRKRKSGELPATIESIYRKKFESVFGPVESLSLFRTENMAPVALATLIISMGWVLVVEPESIFNRSLLPAFTPGSQPAIPLAEFRFGFLGAYFYILQMLVRRYFQNDLKTHAYVNGTMRIIVVLLLVWVLSEVLPGEALQPFRLGFAFVVGVFPQVGWQALVETLKARFKGTVRSLDQAYPLSDLDGLTTWYESRLLEEGIEDMQNLATCNLVDAMLNTRIPVERLVDWVDQSVLYLHVGPEKADREKLRRYGIRCATDLMDAFAAPRGQSGENGLSEQLQGLLNDTTHGPSRLLAILKTFRNDPNLVHVRAWKTTPIHVDLGRAGELAERAVDRATLSPIDGPPTPSTPVPR